jgi:hypothetical protein
VSDRQDIQLAVRVTEMDTMPNNLLRQLSGAALADFAIKMRGERNMVRAWWEQATNNLRQSRDDLEAARGACKRMAEQIRGRAGRYDPS